jgi:hypothetical protein
MVAADDEKLGSIEIGKQWVDDPNAVAGHDCGCGAESESAR